MSDILSKGNLFPEELVNTMINQVKGESALAKLSASTPIPFNGMREFTFSLDREVDLVAENGAKTKGGVTVEPVTIVPVKVEYGARVSDEFRYASESVQLDYLANFTEGFARKVARGIDIMAMHGFNPRTSAASNVIGSNCFDLKVNQTVTQETTPDPEDDMESAVALITAWGNEVTGAAFSPAFRAQLAQVRTYEGGPVKYPELAWGGKPESLNGLQTEFNQTVAVGNEDMAIIGDFARAFRWGYAKEIPLEIIQFGNPDNDDTMGDLKGHNQIYLRTEAYIGWGILDAAAFARITRTAP